MLIQKFHNIKQAAPVKVVIINLKISKGRNKIILEMKNLLDNLLSFSGAPLVRI